MKKISILFTILFFSVICNAQIVYLKGVLQGAQEVSQTATGAGGVVIVRYNMTTNSLELWGNYRNLSSTINGSHIHGSASPGNNAGIIVHLTNTGGTSGGLTVAATLSDVNETALLAGNTYVNVHSANFGGGEIRAQLTPIAQGKAVLLNGRLQGAQEEPPVNSPATGMTNVLLDTSTHTVWITATFSGLLGTANGAHIHNSPPHVAGPVIIHLKHTAANAGSIDTSVVISVENEMNILTNNTYLNVHSTAVGSGEIRGQILPATQFRYLANSLSGSQEVPPTPSAGRGTVIVRYNTETNFFELLGDYQNLSSNVVAAHIHGPATAGSNADVIFSVTHSGGTMGRLTRAQTITEAQEMDLLNGLLYVNVHTDNFGGGEVRGQLLPLSSGETQLLTAAMDVNEENAAFTTPVTSGATGSAIAVLDKITGNLFLTGSYTGLTSGITNAHIHRGPFGVSGPVAIGLQFVAGSMAGTVTGSATNLRTTLMDSIIAGNSYVNIHTSTNGAGEIRGQLGNLVLPVKLTYFNAYKDRGKVALVWSSAQEINLKSYDVEQQDEETKSWIKKGTIIAKGGTAATNYRFIDAPLIGKSAYVIYRLKMNDADGKFSFSSTVRINYQRSKGELTILSNPVRGGVLRYTITGLPAEKAEASVIDFKGRVVVKTTVSTLFNNEINVSQLAPGLYNLVVRVNDELMQQSFIK